MKSIDIIPPELEKACVDYFNSKDWFYIRNPKLGYLSPYRVIKEALENVESVLRQDTNFGK
jgi:hypothetical protein